MYVYIYAFVLQFVAVGAIINVTLIVSPTTATLECTLPCFSPDIWCRLFSITPNNSAVLITYDRIMGSSMSYSYPTKQIMISNLSYNTAYEYCVVGSNTTNNDMTVGDPVCGNFTTAAGTYM